MQNSFLQRDVNDLVLFAVSVVNEDWIYNPIDFILLWAESFLL